ncbi:hypothetical protein MA16_Dca018792 [Dendrobium catenatum]|uniref:Uncharacterized protein n=1 Tax=Dendrobium catenatum TaxID=906689 RepID=A0A2I0X3Y3_9ASPA|nr:hypothetical protein MA16_Dca018792 [Dendrobium catenatum]
MDWGNVTMEDLIANRHPSRGRVVFTPLFGHKILFPIHLPEVLLQMEQSIEVQPLLVRGSNCDSSFLYMASTPAHRDSCKQFHLQLCQLENLTGRVRFEISDPSTKTSRVHVE